ncbi:ABC transporter substrate-binding protein [Pelagibius sp.]|uniref:ABC transporter substrate-binding protein n=1 Tax=Pelagibius sp. TaxID=1931238 RepID=UPI00262A5B5D|nr:ABC transporter substrate-binding protein [Pelagibius sp.]
MIRRLCAAVFVSVLFFATPGLAQDKSRVTIAAPWEVTSFDPAVSGFAIQKLEIMENLVDADETGALRPGLATSWSASEDGLTWTFQLRDGVRFHDGTVFDSAAAAQALTRAWQQPGVLAKAPVSGVSANGHAVVFTLERPFAALPALLAHATTIIQAPSALDADGQPAALIGTGPFKVERFTPPQSIDLLRNDSYWGVAPKLAKASYLAAGRAETRALLAESGDADMVFTLDPSGFARLGDVDSVKTVAVPIPRVVTLKVNAGHRFFSDPRARQALSLAINRDGIAAAITRFPEAAAGQLFPPALSGWHDPALPRLGFDMEAAKGLLAELGWTAGDDGILVKDGERFSILLRTFPDRPELPLIAAALQDQWRQIGVELEVSVANYSEIPAGHQDGTLHVALYARNYSLTPDPIGTVLQDFGSGGGDWGAMGWENAEVADALTAIAATGDQTLRSKNIARVARILHDELPVIPIVWYQHTVAIASGLQGVIIDPLQRSYGLSKISWSE